MLSRGTITFPRTKTAIDLVWGNNYVEQRIIKCRIARSFDHGSDHYPVETILNLQPCPYGPEAVQPYNYKKMDWKAFEQKLQIYLPPLNYFGIPTAEKVNQLADGISSAIQRATQRPHPQLIYVCLLKDGGIRMQKNFRSKRSEAKKYSTKLGGRKMKKDGKSIDASFTESEKMQTRDMAKLPK